MCVCMYVSTYHGKGTIQVADFALVLDGFTSGFKGHREGICVALPL